MMLESAELQVAHERADAEVVRLAMDVGEQLLISGGEVSRVEDTISRILNAYGADRVDVFAITSMMVTTAIWPDGSVITQSRRISSSQKNMRRLQALNSLSRRICSEHISVEVANEEFEKILATSGNRKLLIWIGSILAVISYTAFFGGTWQDVLIAPLIASVIYLSQLASERLGGNRILSNVLSCFVASTVAFLAVSWGLKGSVESIMAGGIMVLIPGISMTSAVENLMLGDTLSGLLGVLEAAMTALALAGGYAMAVLLVGGAV